MSKKSIIIVNNNLEIGGVQKALVNLLRETSDIYDVSLLLFSATGDYKNKIPDNVKLIKCNSLYRYLGISQGQCVTKKDFFLRGALAFLTRVFGRELALKIISLSQKRLAKKYDCAISFLHNGNKKSFYGGCNEFVLNKIIAEMKVTFLHCDYSSCGANYKANNKKYLRFDKIAACSEGCRSAFLKCLPTAEEKATVVRNCHSFGEIKALSGECVSAIDENSINILSVARLSREKGIDRGITALSQAIKQGAKAKYHIVGDGIMRASLEALCGELEIKDNVIFYGNQTNPYKYMAVADLLLIPSYHEAAPLVIDEARSLGLPVLSTATTSSEDMIIKADCGWVCDNSQKSLNQKLTQLIFDKNELKSKKEKLQNLKATNKQALKEFCGLMEGN